MKHPIRMIIAGGAAAVAALLLLPTLPLATAAAADDPFAALESFREEIGFRDARSEYRLAEAVEVGYGTVYRFQQIGGGMDVYGRTLSVSVDKNGRPLFYSGNYLDVSDFAEGDAVRNAEDETREEADAEAIVWSLGHAPVKAYSVLADGERKIFSSLDGSLLAEEPLSPSIVTREQTDADGNTVQIGIEPAAGSGYYLADYTRNIFLYNSRNSTTGGGAYFSTTGTFSDGMAVSVYRNLVDAYDFYTDESNIGATRYGVDGNNDDVAGNYSLRGEIVVEAYVHYGRNYENAQCYFENGMDYAVIMVGDGSPSGTLYRPGRATDVIAHEYQHAITESMCGLVYLNESGALNEAISDIFGALVEGDPSDEGFWTVGENAVPSSLDCLRSFALPSGDYKINADDKYPLCHRIHNHVSCDNGGVHSNSTIPTHAQYKMWKARPDFFTRERIGTLWYAVLPTLTPNATFAEFSEALLNTAKALGYDSSVLSLMEDCLFSSGMLGGNDNHLVTFLDSDGSIVEQYTVHSGDSVTPPEMSDRPYSAQLYYRFNGWDAPLDSVTRDLRVHAQYTAELRTYTVTFLDADGEVLSKEQVVYGGSASPPPPPSKSSSEDYDYLFRAWDVGYTNVERDVVVRPLYNSVRCYTVRFYVGEELLSSVRVRSGGKVASPPTPKKESTPAVDYIFEGWDAPLDSVTEDMSVNALFTEQPRSYTVRFVCGDESFEKSGLYGEEIALPAPETELLGGKVFEGWYLDEQCTQAAEPFALEGDAVLYAKLSEPSSCSLSAGGLLLLPALLLSVLPLLTPRKHRKRNEK